MKHKHRLSCVSCGTVGAGRFKDTGGSRDTHETDTRTSQTNLKTNPTRTDTRATDHTRDPNPGTHTRWSVPCVSIQLTLFANIMNTTAYSELGGNRRPCVKSGERNRREA